MSRRTRSWVPEVLAGAVAGAVGSGLMGPVQRLLSRITPERARAREQAVRPEENPTEKVGRVALQTVGLPVPERQRPKLGQGVHFGYGMAWGAVYGLLRFRFPRLPPASGLLLGAGLWLLGDELALPALGLAPPAKRYPKETHLRALAAHLAYGASVEGATRALNRVWA